MYNVRINFVYVISPPVHCYYIGFFLLLYGMIKTPRDVLLLLLLYVYDFKVHLRVESWVKTKVASRPAGASTSWDIGILGGDGGGGDS
jgi:hypothetical protein